MMDFCASPRVQSTEVDSVTGDQWHTIIVLRRWPSGLIEWAFINDLLQRHTHAVEHLQRNKPELVRAYQATNVTQVQSAVTPDNPHRAKMN